MNRMKKNFEKFITEGAGRKLYIKFRAVQIERRIRNEEKHYQTLADKNNIKVLVGEELEVALRLRLAEREIKHSKKNVVAELNILYVTNLSANPWEGHQIPPALKKLGNLTVYSIEEYGFDSRRPDWKDKRNKFNVEFIKYIEAEHMHNPFDVMITYRNGFEFDAQTLRKVGSLGIVVYSYHWDDRISFKGKRINNNWTGPCGVIGGSDLHLTCSTSSLIKYFVEGGLAYFWPEAANPDHFKPLDFDFEYDVSFVGGKYGPRVDYIDYLRKNGIDVAAFGSGWNNGRISNEEIPEIYSKSKINLGFSGIQRSMREMHLKARDFEVPMSGAVYLTCDQPDIYKVYEVGKEVIVFKNKKEMLQKVKYLLSHPEVCAKIRKAARKRCVEDHTWVNRFKEVFQMTGLIK